MLTMPENIFLEITLMVPQHGPLFQLLPLIQQLNNTTLIGMLHKLILMELTVKELLQVVTISITVGGNLLFN